MRKINKKFTFPDGTNYYLHKGDCVAYMKTMPSKSVDLLLTDIPYGEVNEKSLGHKWMYRGKGDEVTFNLREVIEEFIRISRGYIYVFCGTKQFSEIVTIMEEYKLSTRPLIWKKTNPSPLNSDWNFRSGAEMCVVGRPTNATFNGYALSNVLEYPVCNGRIKKHECQKPLKLMRDLVQISSNEGDVVFDPFMGSGTTGEAALGLGRKFVGCELVEKYFDNAEERVRETELNIPEAFCDGRYQYRKREKKQMKCNIKSIESTSFRDIDYFLNHRNRLLILYNDSINKEATTRPVARTRRVICASGIRNLSPMCICTVSYQTADLPDFGIWNYAELNTPAAVLYSVGNLLYPYPNGPPLPIASYCHRLT